MSNAIIAQTTPLVFVVAQAQRAPAPVLVVIRSANYMAAFRRFARTSPGDPDHAPALAALLALGPHNGPQDCVDIAREEAQMRHDEEIQ